MLNAVANSVSVNVPREETSDQWNTRFPMAYSYSTICVAARTREDIFGAEKQRDKRCKKKDDNAVDSPP
jgi:hypothetical protein